MKHGVTKFTSDQINKMSDQELRTNLRIYRDMVKKPSVGKKLKQAIEVEICYLLREVQERDRIEKLYRGTFRNNSRREA